MDNYVYISSISIFSPVLLFYYDFIIYIDFTHIAASNTATDDVINWVIHRVLNILFVTYFLRQKLCLTYKVAICVAYGK